MITGMEEAVASVIADALAEDATIAAVPYVVRVATSRDEVPGDRSVVAVRLSQGERPMVALIDVVAEVFVLTPANNENTSVENHSLLEQAVDRVFSPGTTLGEDEEAVSIADALSEAIEEHVPGYTGGGFFNQGWTPGREDTNWIPTLSVKVGAVRASDEEEE